MWLLIFFSLIKVWGINLVLKPQNIYIGFCIVFLFCISKKALSLLHNHFNNISYNSIFNLQYIILKIIFFFFVFKSTQTSSQKNKIDPNPSTMPSLGLTFHAIIASLLHDEQTRERFMGQQWVNLYMIYGITMCEFVQVYKKLSGFVDNE